MWKHAPNFYEHFWIQTCETYPEFGWTPENHRTGEDLGERFRRDEENLARPAFA